jgi:hypothetical protein
MVTAIRPAPLKGAAVRLAHAIQRHRGLAVTATEDERDIATGQLGEAVQMYEAELDHHASARCESPTATGERCGECWPCADYGPYAEAYEERHEHWGAYRVGLEFAACGYRWSAYVAQRVMR